ncbi:MAG: N-acetylmuramoyl-L-alanine amidase [Pseudomonadota bacterium]
MFQVPFSDAAGIRTDRKIIVIDPGHGGTSPGSTTPSGTREKDINLTFSRMVAQILEKDFTVVLTRTDDISMSQDERTAIANLNRADLFISLHAKPVTANNTGVSIYFYQPSQDQHKLPPDAWNSAQVPYISRSRVAAETICRTLSPQSRIEECTMGAPVAVLSGAVMPALLIEPFSMAGLTEAVEKSDDLMHNTALDLAGGIEAFFAQEKGAN